MEPGKVATNSSRLMLNFYCCGPLFLRDRSKRRTSLAGYSQFFLGLSRRGPFGLFPNAKSSTIVRMPDDDLVNLIHQVVNHEEELTEQTKVIKRLTDRVGVLETDMLNIIALFQKLRAFAHVHPGLERQAEEYENLVNVLRERYKIPEPSAPA